MILAMVFQRPDYRNFLREMDADDFQDWLAFYLRSPWGPSRDDQRQAVLLSWLVKMFAGGKEESPNLTFPYFGGMSLLDQEAMLKLAIETEAAMEDDGKGGYRWKGGKKPQALIEAEERIERDRKEREEASKPGLW